MTAEVLEPRLDLFTQEYVLVQAWKKTASYIRYHNWYSDTLELDRAAVNLRRFLDDLKAQLSQPAEWRNDPLRMVPAPKSQQWHVVSDPPRWEPVERSKTESKLRPLAHVSLKDQVAATAVMLCLADRVETLQGDPRSRIDTPEARKRVVSYGNRLFCDAVGDALRHRWGSGKLYRAYYEDYRHFLSRPEATAEAVASSNNARIVLVHSDLRQFYDRVQPNLLGQKIESLSTSPENRDFFALTRRLFNWEWHPRDSREVAGYARLAGLPDFTRVALPQGLVAAGFFANVALLDFDSALRAAISEEIEAGVLLEDVCRYVDDLRIVLRVDQARTKSLSEIEQTVIRWLQGLLDRDAAGLMAHGEKTIAAGFSGDDRPLVRQSGKMARIQRAVSMGFDAIGGEEILDSVQGLIRSQQLHSQERTGKPGWSLSPVPDVRDATVARFAAGRFRSTYRSLRPLLHAQEAVPNEAEGGHPKAGAGRSRVARTQADLDDETRAFALGLIDSWVRDPSNVRLLRIGLDLWPARDVLERVLALLSPFTKKGGRRRAPRRVAWYCLAEIFRAGATETGFVEESESLPARVDINAYREVLRDEAVRLASLSSQTLPWYLRQQILLFLAATDPVQAPIIRTGSSPETRPYRELIRFLRGEGDGLTGADFATLAILSRRSFRNSDAAVQLALPEISARRLEQIAERDPAFAIEILDSTPGLSDSVAPRVRDDLSLASNTSDEWVSLADLVLRRGRNIPLRNEISLLHFSSTFLEFLEEWPAAREVEAITPSDVLLKLPLPHLGVGELKIVASRVSPEGSMYRPPPWSAADERWRFQLGYLLRFILTARHDFTRVVRMPSWREGTATYRAPSSHWYQRLYGLFNGHSAFGDDWLPISDWTERLLSALLSWPGCRTSDMVDWIRGGTGETRRQIEERIKELEGLQGPSSGVLVMPFKAPSPLRPIAPRPLRACVVQTAVPTQSDFALGDLTLSTPAMRKRHRNHLSAALAAVDRMLALRETHKGLDGRLDWLILPELSVHPDDVSTHLIPFARAHGTIILAGLTYQALFNGEPFVNSALWVIPERPADRGLQVRILRQGKHHLAPNEAKLHVQGFRPCQWLVGYDWSGPTEAPPLWLTASICYDATDLRLAADLRHHSDVFAIPALNKDVNTFDQMALALHYHMFQLVVVANTGEFGGSNAYMPYKEAHVRQVFHSHGQPQATVSFLEIENIGTFLTRKADAQAQYPAPPGPANPNSWKFPPAGL